MKGFAKAQAPPPNPPGLHEGLHESQARARTHANSKLLPVQSGDLFCFALSPGIDFEPIRTGDPESEEPFGGYTVLIWAQWFTRLKLDTVEKEYGTNLHVCTIPKDI